MEVERPSFKSKTGPANPSLILPVAHRTIHWTDVNSPQAVRQLWAPSPSSAKGSPAYLARTRLNPQPRSHRHRFGVNYTPSHNWWFCWNDWNPDPIKRDLDAIAALGADHLRILLVWPFFQPNPKWVSPAHLDRLDQLITLMGERHLDALVTVFTGQLSGWYFLPSFNRLSDGFFTDRVMLDAQELFVRELGRVLQPHQNVIGFDMGNEINTCWSAKTADGDAWMNRCLR